MGTDCVADAKTCELFLRTHRHSVGSPRLQPESHSNRKFRNSRTRRLRLGLNGAVRCGLGPPRRVILWPDTFTNHFDPEIAQAAVEVLEGSGFEVSVPTETMCCGRPLYDFGLLEIAKTYLETILGNLAAEIYANPDGSVRTSCAATFRDELRNILPDHPLAERLSKQTFLLSEFVDKEVPDFPQALDGSDRPAHLGRAALVHCHCHHKAIMKMDAEEKILKKLGVHFEMPDSGCCGMAGAFGFQENHYDVSLKCGERVLLPKVRQASKNIPLSSRTVSVAVNRSNPQPIAGHCTSLRS